MEMRQEKETTIRLQK